MKSRITEIIVTLFFTGKIRFAPGTFGSIVAFPVYYMIAYFAFYIKIPIGDSNLSIIEQQILQFATLELFSIIFLFVIGVYFSNLYIKNLENQDPKEVVIDELVGQMLVLLMSSFSIFIIDMDSDNIMHNKFLHLVILPFILFRIFDIMKPWPIDWCDQNIKGGLGIMLDDVLAAIFAIVTHYTILFCIL